MKIDYIFYRDFKGISSEQRFEQVNLLLGPNGSGKTARLLGPMYAVMGNTPFGDRPEAAAMLGSHRGCGVGITLDDGFQWVRRLVVEPRTGALSTKIDLPGHDGAGLRKCEPLVHEHVGSFAPMFDIDAFLGLSIDRRRDFVMSLCGAAAGLDKKTADALATDIVVQYCRLELGDGTVTEASIGHGGPVAELATKLKSRLAEDVRLALDSMVAQLSGELKMFDITEAIGRALATTKNLANGYKATAEQATQASRKLSDRKNELETVSESVDELELRLTNLRSQREEVAEDMGLAEGRARSVADHRKALDDCAAGIKAASVALATIDEPPDEETIQKRLAELNDEAEKLEKIEEPRNPVAGESQSRIDAATDDLECKEADVRAQMERVATASSARDSATLQFDALANGPWMRCLEIARTLGKSIGKAFPVDSEPKQLWGELATIIANNAEPAVVEEHREAVRNATGGMRTAEESLEPLTHARRAARLEFSEAKDAHANALLAFEADYRRHRDARQTVYDLRDKADFLRTTVDETRQNIEKQRKDLANFRSKQLQHEERLKALLDESSSESVESMQQRADALAREIETLEARVKAKQAYQQLEGELTRCAAAAERERVNHETAKRLADAIRALRDRIMADLVKPLAERMNRFLGWSGINCRAYCRLENDRGSSDFDLGWVVDDTLRVSLPAMSGGESAIYTAALAYAIVDLANPPLKLLLLEIAEVDDRNLQALIRAFIEVGKTGMQVMAATHSLLPYPPPDEINLISCRAGESEQRTELVEEAV